MKKLSDDAFSVIFEEARAMAQCFGVESPDDAAMLLMRRLKTRIGGGNFYLAKRGATERKKAREEICAKFNGGNLFELAKEFDITPRHVRRILAESRNVS